MEGGLVAVKPMHKFGERRCCILMRRLIDVTPLKILVTNLTNQPVLLQKHMRVAVLAEIPTCVVHLRDSAITADEEASHVAEVAIAHQASSVNDNDPEQEEDDPLQRNWR